MLAAGLDCYLLGFPPGIDVNQYALQAADPSQALGAIIRKAEWLGKGQPAVPVPAVESAPPATVPREMEPDESEADDAADEPEDWKSWKTMNGTKWKTRRTTSMTRDRRPTDASPPAVPPVPAPILSASPLPPPPQEIEADVSGDEVTMQLGHRRYRVRGLSKNLAFDQMKVNVLATTDKGMYVDTFDLYIARHRRQFIVQAAIELGVEEQTIKKDLGRVLLKLEELQDEQISEMMVAKEPAPAMTPEEKDEALRLLRDPNLLDRIVADFDVVGETTNKLVGYLAAVSRKLDQPLADHHSIVFRRRKNFPYGCHFVLCAAGGSSQVFGHDGPKLVLHGRNGLEAQDTGDCGRRGSRAGQLRLETTAKRRGVDHRQYGQGFQHGPVGHTGIPGGRAGNDLPDHDGHQDRRRIVEPLHRAVGR